MSIELHDAVNGDGLFDILGKAFFHVQTLNTARGTTVPATSQAFVAQFGKYATPNSAMNAAISGVSQGLNSWKSAGSLSAAQARSFSELYLKEIVNIASAQNSKDRRTALEYLIADMIAAANYVDANAITLTLAADAWNTSTDLTLAYTHKRGDGLVQQNILAEVIKAEVTSTTPSTTPTVKFTSPAAVGDKLSQDWPGGSGIQTSIAATDAASSLVTNGNFQAAATANLPDGWLFTVGVLGTSIKLTTPEVQQIVRSGSASAGVWFIKYTNVAGIVRMTAPLAYDCTASAIQSALNALPDLESVTVANTAGTTPNFTDQITFTGLAGNVTAITVVNMTTGGSFAISEITAGSANSFKGVSLNLVGDGAVKPVLIYPLPTLEAEKVYFCHFRHKKTGTPAAGIVRVAVLGAVGGSVTTDFSSGSNSVSYDLTAGTVTTSFTSGWFSFRLKKTQTQPVYLVIEETTAISAGTTYAIDEVAVVAGSELYNGGPFVAAFSGVLPPIAGDKWTLTNTNSRDGEIVTWMERFFGLSDMELLLPTSGSTLCPDSVIS